MNNQYPICSVLRKSIMDIYDHAYYVAGDMQIPGYK